MFLSMLIYQVTGENSILDGPGRHSTQFHHLTNVPILFHAGGMTLHLAIERHRKPLLRIVATLFAMIGLAEGGRVERLSSPVYRAVLRVLLPAESAVRRLIVVAAHGLTLKPPVKRSTASPKGPVIPRKGRRAAAFQLFDPRQRFGSAFGHRRHRIHLAPRPVPRIRVIDVGFDPRVPLFLRAPPAPPVVPAAPDDAVNAVRLSRRLAAIKLALEDLPRQARRYLRWQAKPPEARRPKFSSALRRGHAPGHRNEPGSHGR